MKFSRNLFFLLIINLLASTYALGQNSQIDSIKVVLSRSKADSNKVKILIELAKTYQELPKNPEKMQPDLALQYARQAYALADSIGDLKWKGRSNKAIGMYYYFDGNKIEAAKYWDQALNNFTEIDDVIGMMNMMNNLGTIHFLNGSMSRALKYYIPMAELAEKYDSKSNLALAYNNVANCYMGIPPDFDQALKYYNKSLKIAQAIKDTSIMGMLYYAFGEVNVKMHQDSLALVNFMNAKTLYQAHDDDNLPDILNSIGRVYQNKKDYITALNYHQLASQKAAQHENKITLLQANLEIAEIYRVTKQHKLSLEYFRKVENISNEVQPGIELRHTYEGLASIYNEQADFRNAFMNQLQATKIADSLNKIDSETRRINFEDNMKDAEIKALQMDKEKGSLEIRNQKNTKNFIIGFIGFLIIGLILAINNVKRKRTNNLLRKQKIEIEHALAELKAAQKQLVQAEKMASLGEMTAGIAHEIQNPLNFVINFSEINKELLDDMHLEINNGNLPEVKAIAADLSQNAEKINQHGHRAGDIIKGMLQHARTNVGQKEPVNINKLTDEYLRLAYHGQRAKDKSFNVVLETDFDQSIGEVNINAQDIGRVLLNIFNNAFYAVSKKRQLLAADFDPMVSVSTKKIGNKLEIRIKDNGMGIPDNVKEKIFQPFFTTKPTGEGTGLGLSISYDIIQAHLGSLNVISEEGGFTAFIIQLPA